MKKLLIPACVLAVALLLLFAIRGHWDTWKSNAIQQKTNDAYVASNQIPLSTRITGTVRRVNVEDYQSVKTNQLILEIDDSDYQAVA
ncbi:MAG TPA: biotin/lipoyl-binding protein, partial [Acidobacteriaceae bacterium]